MASNLSRLVPMRPALQCSGNTREVSAILGRASSTSGDLGGRLAVQICFIDGTAQRLKIDEEGNAVSLKG